VPPRMRLTPSADLVNVCGAHIVAPKEVGCQLSVARVAAGGCPPAAPTDPDVQNSRIRLFGTRIRYAGE
jgi:hypothetical protein